MYGYPRPHRRGPIEATRITTSSSSLSSIRVLTGAAPLKRRHEREQVQPTLGYPRPHRRGPIEATFPPFSVHGMGSIRVLTGAAPLKQTFLSFGVHAVLLSASSQARPH